MGDTLVMTQLFDWMRQWFGAEYVTAWTALQAVATILAFCVAAWYASIAQRQLRAFITEASIGHEPIVFTVREEDPGKANDFHYFVLNVGKGTAVNVWYLDRKPGDGKWRQQSLGALGAGQRRILVDTLEQPLRDAGGDIRHVLAAEGVATRTTRWTLTSNVRGTQQGSHLRGHLIELKNPDHLSLGDLLAEEGDSILRQLNSIESTAD